MGKPAKPSPAAAAEPPKTVHSALLTYASMLSLLSLCPPFVILLWYTMVHADGSVVRTFQHLRDHGLLEGFTSIWPMPTLVAGKIILGFALFEAALQLLLPGKRFLGPVSPSGNVPVYKANGLQAYAVTLVTYLSLWWFGIFNPAIVYDHLGEIYSALVFGSLVFCILLYIKGHVAPSSSDSGSSGNAIIDFYWGMELYPRIGKHFDIKVFTNCRFGMMSWAVLAVTYCIKQYEMNGRVADSMLVNTALMLIYITKFFWWESGYWCTMDIAHDRDSWFLYLLGMLGMGSINIYLSWNVPCQPSCEFGSSAPRISPDKRKMLGLGQSSVKDCCFLPDHKWRNKNQSSLDFWMVGPDSSLSLCPRDTISIFLDRSNSFRSFSPIFQCDVSDHITVGPSEEG